MIGIAFNEDSSHFFYCRNRDQMTIDGVKELIDSYVSPQLKELIFNPNCQRTSYNSKVWTPIWKDFDPTRGEDQPLFQRHFAQRGSVDPEESEGLYRWLSNAWTLHHQGIDPYDVWLKQARQKGIRAWMSMRMNDSHELNNPDSLLHSDFWRGHPEYRRVPYRFSALADFAFDYGHKEVREYHLSLIRELLERYDMDGLELDWMRFGYYFRPGQEEAGCKLLTEFMEEVKSLVQQQEKSRGHRISIGVRVPTHPQTARALGFDAVEWGKRSLVDMITITPFFETCEFDLPIELWKELLGDSPVLLAAGMEILVSPYPQAWSAGRMTQTPETVRGAVVSALHRGADRIYLYNFMDKGNSTLEMMEFQESERHAIMSQIGDLETAIKHSRRHVVTFADMAATGQPRATALPAECKKDQPAIFRIHIGLIPVTGEAYVYFGLGTDEKIDGEIFDVRVNGEPCRYIPNKTPGTTHPIVKQILGYQIDPADLNHGYNVVEIIPKTESTYTVVWVEIKILP